MSTSDIDQPFPAQPQRRSLTRSLLIGFGLLLLAGALLILALNNGSETGISGAGRALIFAPAVFLAGLLSFLSPCTLPILPAYFAFTFQARRERIVLMTIAFFLGLATTVVLLGATATAISQILFSNMRQITQIGGLLVIGFGIMSVLGKGFTGARLIDRPSTSVAGSYIYGATFALGWTACVGPIYGTVLGLLTTQGIAVFQGAILAFIYALGIGLPLIIVASFFSQLGTGSRFWRLMRGRGFSLHLGVTTLDMHSTSLISGVLMIGMGVLLATDQLIRISSWTQSLPLAQWTFVLEQQLQSLFGM